MSSTGPPRNYCGALKTNLKTRVKGTKLRVYTTIAIVWRNMTLLMISPAFHRMMKTKLCWVKGLSKVKFDHRKRLCSNRRWCAKDPLILLFVFRLVVLTFFCKDVGHFWLVLSYVSFLQIIQNWNFCSLVVVCICFSLSCVVPLAALANLSCFGFPL